MEPGDTTSIWYVSWGRHPISRKWRHRIPLKLAVYRWRIRDAWLVLTGKAEID